MTEEPIPLHQSNPFLSKALAYVEKGLYVLPICPRGKEPLTQHGLKDATITPAQVSDWWARWPDANIGIATGEISNIWVLDLDGGDGETSLRKLEATHSPLPSTVEVISGGKGRHLYFRYPRHTDIRNSAGKIAAGIDVRGTGGYIIAPPSIHPSGAPYVRSVDSASSIADAPSWLLELISSTPKKQSAQSFDEWRDLLSQPIGEGRRNDSIARISGLLLMTGIDPFLALEMCRAINESRCQPPLPDAEVIRIVNSIAQRELEKSKG